MSVTSVGHAETGRMWQSRDFWWRADALIGGDLLSRYDAYQAARAAPEEPAAEEPPEPLPVLPASVTITPDGVVVVWPDGAEVLVRPPGRQDCNRSEGISMTETAEAPPAVTAGVSPAELEVMRQAAARLTGTGSATGAEDQFGALAAPFRPAPGARAVYQRSGGHHWCTVARP